MNSPELLIQARSIQKNKVRFYLSKDFNQKYVRRPLALTYPDDIELEQLPQSIIDIPLITNVIAVIWFSGQSYAIEEMDENLHYSLRKIKEFFQRFFYNTEWNGELIPDRLVKNTITQSTIRSASLFSGGLDSTATVLRHFDERPTLISFNEPHELAAAWAISHHFDVAQIYANHQEFLKLTYLNRASIDITKWFWDTSMGMALTGMAAPFLYAKGIPVLYIPSGFTWRHFLYPDGQTMLQPASPLIDENMSPMGVRVYHDDFSMTRTDKIKFISLFCSQRNIPKPLLVVCTHHGRSDTTYTHCNKCFKCSITMLDILAIGDRFGDYGFTLSEKDFIAQFKSYIATLKMRRGGTYSSLLDSQRYIQQNFENLPAKYRPFYRWFLSVDLWSRVDTSSRRPLRSTPFRWSDYADLYPGVKEYIDENGYL